MTDHEAIRTVIPGPDPRQNRDALRIVGELISEAEREVERESQFIKGPRYDLALERLGAFREVKAALWLRRR